MLRLAIFMALSACTVATAQVQVEDLCVPYDGVMIAGVTPDTTTLDHEFAFDDLSGIQSLVTEATDLDFTSIDAHAITGSPDLHFVDSAHVTIASGDPSSPLPTVDVYDCDGDCVPDGVSLEVSSKLGQSALAYVASGSVLVDLEIDGQLPVDDWTMNVDVCFQGKLAFHESL